MLLRTVYKSIEKKFKVVPIEEEKEKNERKYRYLLDDFLPIKWYFKGLRIT